MKGFLLLFLLSFNYYCTAESILNYTGSQPLMPVRKGLMIMEVYNDFLSFNEVVNSDKFIPYPEKFPGFNAGHYWVKFKIKNASNLRPLLLMIGYGTYEKLQVYTTIGDHFKEVNIVQEGFADFQKKFRKQHYILDLNFHKDSTITFYIEVKSKDMILLPIHIGTPIEINEFTNREDMLFGIYTGIFLSMICYNIFLYFSIRDRIYLYYVIYIFLISFSQIILYGYLSRFLLVDYPVFNQWLSVLVNGLIGIFSNLFIRSFLNIKAYAPRLNRVITIYSMGYFIYFLLAIVGLHKAREILFDTLGFIGCVFFYICIYIAIKNKQRTGKYLLLAWTIFFVGYILFILRNEGLLPYNFFTTYSVTVGSAIETLLLSFALADRINVLRADNEIKKNEIIKYLETNEEYLRMSQQLAIDAERLKKEVLITEFESLKSQVNPHFLFNSLNVLAELVYEAQEDAVKFIDELASIYRYILDCKQKEVTNLENELRFISSYIFLLKIRFEDNLIITITLPEDLDTLIPPITLQLLIENAIKHNVVSTEDPLKIDIYAENGYILVRSNIHLRRTKEKSTGIGLNNIISRYSFFTAKEVIIVNDGMYFTVKIPIINPRS